MTTLANWTFAKTARQGTFLDYLLQAIEKYLWDVSGHMIKELKSTSRGYQIGKVNISGSQMWFYFTYKGDGSEFDADYGPVPKGHIHVKLSPVEPHKGYAVLHTPNGPVDIWKGNPQNLNPQSMSIDLLGGKCAEYLGTWG